MYVIQCHWLHEYYFLIVLQIDRIIQYIYIYGNSVPIMLCNALIGVYFLIRGIQAVISILIGKVMSTYVVDIATYKAV